MCRFRYNHYRFWKVLIACTIFTVTVSTHAQSGKKWEILSSIRDGHFIAYMDSDYVSEVNIQRIGRQICENRNDCSVSFYSDPDLAPRTRNDFPRTKASLNAYLGLYSRNRKINYEWAAVNCDLLRYVGCISTRRWQTKD